MLNHCPCCATDDAQCALISLMLGTVASVATAAPVNVQVLSLRPAGIAGTAALSRALPRLARNLRERYHSRDRVDSLDNAFRLQLVEGDYESAMRSVGASDIPYFDRTAERPALVIKALGPCGVRYPERSGVPFPRQPMPDAIHISARPPIDLSSRQTNIPFGYPPPHSSLRESRYAYQTDADRTRSACHGRDRMWRQKEGTLLRTPTGANVR